MVWYLQLAYIRPWYLVAPQPPLCREEASIDAGEARLTREQTKPRLWVYGDRRKVWNGEVESHTTDQGDARIGKDTEDRDQTRR